MLELVRGQLHLVDLHDGIPQLLVLLLQHDHHAGGLRVEGAGDMLDGVGDELFDAGVGDGRLVGDLVVGTTAFGRVEEGLGLGHGGWGRGEVSLRGGVCLPIGGGERREEGGRKSIFIRVVG